MPSPPAATAAMPGHAAGRDAPMSVLRGQAQALGTGTDLSRCDDHQIIDMLQALAPAASTAPLGMSRLALTPAASAPAPAPAAGGGGSGRAAAAAPPPVVPPAGALSATLDVAAMAQVLRDAARDGVPFCEECERARQQRAAEAA